MCAAAHVKGCLFLFLGGGGHGKFRIILSVCQDPLGDLWSFHGRRHENS